MPPSPSIKSKTAAPASTPAEAPHSLRLYYDVLHGALGPQHWWPGRTPFEIIVGAILTQNTSWSNVERAISNLRKARLLTPSALERVPAFTLAKLIRSSGYFRQKTRKLKFFLRFLRREYRGSLARMFRTPTARLRKQLLAVHGIGPETADSILLYAGKHPAFVVDAYTRRILQRHGHSHPRETYEEIRARLESALPADTRLYNEYHALIVAAGKHWCRTKNPLCSLCPLAPYLPESLPVLREPGRASPGVAA